MTDPTPVSLRNNPHLGLNISDVIAVIGQDDQDFANSSDASVYGGAHIGGGGGAQSEANYSTLSTSSRNDPDFEAKKRAYVKILEQPQPKALRFRYICEGRSAGSIPGIRSTAENKTFPAIQVMNYKGQAVVVVSCVTVDPPYRPHPHNLVGKEGCKKGVCTMTINNDSMQCVFSNLGIQCVKKRDVEDALKLREDIRVDPFQTGFTHRNQPQSIDLNSLRLCFQVFLEGSTKGKFTHPLKPVVSDPIYDKKATSDLIICKLSDCTSSVAGGKEIILLCDKVTKEDIYVRFYEVKDGLVEWEAFGDFQASDVHKQVAISFKTPRYKTLEVENPVKVYVQLLRPSDKAVSESRPFQYLPLDSGRPFTSFKRLKNNYGLFQRILGLDSPTSNAVVAEDSLRRKTPSLSPKSPTGGFLDVLGAEETKPRPPMDLKILGLPAGSHIRPPAASSPPLSSQQRSAVSPQTAANISSVCPSTSPPLLMSPNQSVDDIRQRLTATLERRRTGATSPRPLGVGQQPHTSVLWSDDASVYSDVDILDEVLSQGSVNDLLSAVGDGLAVYEDVAELPDAPNNNNNLALHPETVYGDPSYTSCYSNLEFFSGQPRPPSATGAAPSPAMACETLAKVEVPALPPKKNPRGSTLQSEDDFGIYGTPSGQPIHPNKEALLMERGFSIGIGGTLTGIIPEHQNGTQSSEVNRVVDNAIYSHPGGTLLSMASPDCDVLEDMFDEAANQTQECSNDKLPRTVLDLFV